MSKQLTMKNVFHRESVYCNDTLCFKLPTLRYAIVIVIYLNFNPFRLKMENRKEKRNTS